MNGGAAPSSWSAPGDPKDLGEAFAGWDPTITEIIDHIDKVFTWGLYDREPLPADHPLRSLGNTVLTPHLGYVTGDTYEVFYPQTVEAIRAYLAGKPVRVIPAA